MTEHTEMAAMPPTEMALEWPTESLGPPYAWGDETDSVPNPKPSNRSVVAIAVVAGIALAIAVVAAVVVLLSPRPTESHYVAPVTPVPTAVPVPTSADPAPPPAPTQDEIYLQALVDGGIGIKDRTIAIGGGHWTCAYLNDHSAADAITWLDNAHTHDAAGHVWNHAMNTAFVNAAIAAYCPQYR